MSSYSIILLQMGIGKASKNGIFYDLVLNERGGGSGSPNFLGGVLVTIFLY